MTAVAALETTADAGGEGATTPWNGDAPARILYIVPDTLDPAAIRRVRMFEAGGALVRLAGFRRGPAPAGLAADFGLTKPAKLAERALSVVRISLSLSRYWAAAAGVDVIVCRNLECLSIGERLRARYAPGARLVYEVLDIHRVMVRSDLAGRMLRRLEAWLAARCDLMLTSSPAFLDRYFAQYNPVAVPVGLVENKIFPPPEAKAPAETRRSGRPFVIGWFGVIRCRRSLALLCALAKEMDGAVEVIIRGRPALHEFDDFDGTVASAPHVTFLGPYRNPDDLPAIYGAVDFVWAIDFFEEGLNSSWLLPNRLYEGCYFGAVPLAVEAVETGRWLAARKLGVLLGEPCSEALVNFFRNLTATHLDQLRAALRTLPDATWLAGEEQCRDLVALAAGTDAVAHGARP